MKHFLSNNCLSGVGRRKFFKASLGGGMGALFFPLTSQENILHGESLSSDNPLMEPFHDMIVCPWTPEHPRHDHQIIFPLDKERLLLVWSEYFVENPIPYPYVRQGHVHAQDHVSCQISSMVSIDRGRTWGDRKVMQQNQWKLNVKHPNLIRLSEKEILFSYVGWDSPAQRNVFMRRSTDNGLTWGEQFQISEPGWYCNNNGHALRLENGRIILPAHGTYADNYIGGEPYLGYRTKLHSFVFYSDDGFKTWHRSANSMTTDGRGCHEPTIVELKDGRLLCFLRNTNKRIFRSYSEDNGTHWSDPEPTELPAPEAPSRLIRIPATGDLLLLWNNVASSSNWPRTPLTAAISKDEGNTWHNYRNIDNRQNYDAAYSSVTFVKDEALIAYYTRPTYWKRDCEVTLKIFKIDQFYSE